MHRKLNLVHLPLWSRRPNLRACSTKMPASQSYKRRRVACQHSPEDQTLQLQAGAGEHDFTHLSGPDRVAANAKKQQHQSNHPPPPSPSLLSVCLSLYLSNVDFFCNVIVVSILYVHAKRTGWKIRPRPKNRHPQNKIIIQILSSLSLSLSLSLSPSLSLPPPSLLLLLLLFLFVCLLFLLHGLVHV